MNFGYPVLERPLQEIELYVTDHPRLARPRRSKTGLGLLDEPEAYQDWHYTCGYRSSRIPWIGMSVAAGLIAVSLLAFNHRPKAKKVIYEESAALELVDWPKLAPEPEETSSDTNEARADEGVEAPTLPDVPTSVSIENSFVQEIDYSSFRPNNTVSSTSLSAIPAIVRHGGGGTGRKLSDLFNIADLDRVPQAVFQPIPKVTVDMLGGYPKARATVEFIVTKTGEVIEARVIDADTSKVGDLAASAISRWKFRPGMKNGRAVNTRMRQPMYFTSTADS